MKCVSNCVKKLQIQQDYFHKVPFNLYRDFQRQSDRLPRQLQIKYDKRRQREREREQFTL